MKKTAHMHTHMDACTLVQTHAHTNTPHMMEMYVLDIIHRVLSNCSVIILLGRKGHRKPGATGYCPCLISWGKGGG